MKEKHLRMFRRIFAGTAILAILVPVRAQVSNPSAWEVFVKSTDNILLVDTFMRQSFLGESSDNWEYTADGGAAVPQGKKTMLIPPGGSLSFVSFPTGKYSDVTICFRLAADKLEVGEDLQIQYLQNEDQKTELLYRPKKKDDFFSFKNIQVSGSSLKMEVSVPSKDDLDGCYMVNSFLAFGKLTHYSLFLGSGNWEDDVCWSHFSPSLEQGALISGTVTVDSSVKCRSVSLGNEGRVHITESGSLDVDTLYSYGNDFSLTVQGELSVKENITLQYTFPEKGKWYFLSFPFDVYLKEIDNRFQLKDEQFTGNGDYFYMLTYNGDKRSSTQTPTGNWEVFSLPASSDNPLVFERGKGYLVALDAAASDNTLTFSVEGENIPEDFGKTLSIPVNVASSMDAGDDNSGWYLCGNPLPAPLKLSQIQPDPALDGNIYLYDGKNYAPYAIGSNYELPPLAAFFVKASATTELTVTNEPSTAKAVLLKSGYPLRSELTEPINVKTQLSKIRKENEMSILKGNVLYLSGLSSVGKLKVVDVAGQLVYSCPVPQGSSVQSLPLRGGLYILIIEAGGYRARHKCVLTQ